MRVSEAAAKIDTIAGRTAFRCTFRSRDRQATESVVVVS
jgi:hypothetical protein